MQLRCVVWPDEDGTWPDVRALLDADSGPAEAYAVNRR